MFPFDTITVSAHERAVEYVDGVHTRVLGPGRYRCPRRATYVRTDVRERIVTTAPQEVMTSDGVSVRLTAALRWRIVEARTFAEAVVDPAGVVYLAVQLALRDAMLDTDVESLLRRARGDATATLTEAARATGLPLGIEVAEVVVKDVILPLELRQAYAELVTTRTRGLSQLEAARAETAALRSLANGAKLLDDHPALARLRLVQALPPGATVELGLTD